MRTRKDSSLLPTLATPEIKPMVNFAVKLTVNLSVKFSIEPMAARA